MSVTKVDLHAEQKAHAATRVKLDEVTRQRDAAWAEMRPTGDAVASNDDVARLTAEVAARDEVIKEANRRLTAIGAKPVSGALR